MPLTALRQAAAEILACAVLDLFPGALLVCGEASNIGFYYDFVLKQTLDEHGLVLIEERMRTLIKQNKPIQILHMMRENAMEFFKHQKQTYKIDLLACAKENIVEVFNIENFHDYCPPTTIINSQEIGAVKLFSAEPATAFLPESNAVKVIRISGTAFPNSYDLKKFLKKVEAAKAKDHRLLGKEMDLFSAPEEAGTDCWLWHPKGSFIRETLLDFWRSEHCKQGFQLIKPPLLSKSSSDRSKKNPKLKLEDAEYAMSSNHSAWPALVFKSKERSYRELPLRYAEYSDRFNPEKITRLWGLFRTRNYLSDHGYIFCAIEQVLEELISSLHFIDKTVKIFGFEYHWYLCTQSEKFTGTLDSWKIGIDQLIKALDISGFNYTLDKEKKALYGPRVEVRFIDALGQEWEGPSLSMDFSHPKRFGLYYQGEDDQKHIPVMLNRSIFGSLERFIAILIEHYAGLLPLWLAPEQIRVIPVAEKNVDYANLIRNRTENSGFRVRIDYRKGSLGGKIHAAEREKIPYIFVVGDKEEKNDTIAVRTCQHEAIQKGLKLDLFLEQLHKSPLKI